MTEEQIALARRAVACKGWRWMPGMSIGGLFISSVSGLGFAPYGRVLNVRDDDGMQMVSASEYPYDDYGVPEYRLAELTHIPDITDPATLGCLRALVREAWDDDEAYAIPWHDDDGGWTVAVNDEDGTHNIAQGNTEVEALIDALETAP